MSTRMTRPHRSSSYMRPTATGGLAWSAGLSVGLSVTIVSPSKAVESIVTFGMFSRVGPRNHLLYGVQIPTYEWGILRAKGGQPRIWPAVDILKAIGAKPSTTLWWSTERARVLGEGCSSPPPATGSRERHKLPSWVRGKAPATWQFKTFYALTKPLMVCVDLTDIQFISLKFSCGSEP